MSHALATSAAQGSCRLTFLTWPLCLAPWAWGGNGVGVHQGTGVEEGTPPTELLPGTGQPAGDSAPPPAAAVRSKEPTHAQLPVERQAHSVHIP